MSQIEIYQLPPPEVAQPLAASFIRTRILTRYVDFSNHPFPPARHSLYLAFPPLSY
ncbi:baseplate assembly protein, partial [Vibrio cholerae]